MMVERKETAHASPYIIINHTRPIAISQPPLLRLARSRFIHEAEVFPRVQIDFTPAGAREQIVRRAWTPRQAMRQCDNHNIMTSVISLQVQETHNEHTFAGWRTDAICDCPLT